VTLSSLVPRLSGGFRHEAVIYHSLAGFVDQVLPFVQEGLDRGEPVLVAALPDRTAALREALGAAAGGVSFVDMAEVGRNPARIIPVWRAFVDRHGSARNVRGVGEPVWDGRRAAELEECRLHESLLNVAFDGGPAWRLMCPYDGDALPAAVLEDVRRTHPVVGPEPATLEGYEGQARAFTDFATPLSAPHVSAAEISFGPADLCELRNVVRRLCAGERLSPDVSEDLVLAVHELATNSIRHGGGGGVLRAWSDADALVLEVSDAGEISDPLVGRELETQLAEGGRGVWIANQLCDLVQVRSSSQGTAVRLHTWL
jgi:anti-sigma regulatory factor (Ser/Thr protein kinase)